jgi:homoserine O-acetyltransferase
MNDAAPDDDIPNATPAEPGEVGLVEPRDYVSNEPFTCDDGQILSGFTVRYETYGRLNAARENAILVCHALSGDHHCAGIHALTDKKPGWWNNLIGPGKALDTNKFFVLCANVLGGCQGSSGPASTNPATGRAFGISFPAVTIRDMVRAQRRWLDSLGLTSLYAALGGSMGGMQALQWGIEYPAFCAKILAMATTAREGAQAIATAMCRARDLINTPANHLGPAELAAAVGEVAALHGAAFRVIERDELARGFPAIQAVGQGSPRTPRVPLTARQRSRPRAR